MQQMAASRPLCWVTLTAQSRHPATICNAAMRPSIADVRVARKSGLVSTPDGAAAQVNWQIS